MVLAQGSHAQESTMYIIFTTILGVCALACIMAQLVAGPGELL